MFGKKKKVVENRVPYNKTIYPTGVCVHSENGHWFIKGTNRYKIVSDRVLKSWSFPRIIETTEQAIEHYTVMGRLGFRDGTLVADMAGNVYIVADSKRRRVTTPDWFDLLGVDFKDAMVISDEELKLHPEGEVLK